MGEQRALFGEPELKPALSQWFTPPWLAKKIAAWVPCGVRVLEPSCGSGNLIEALLRAGHAPANITGVELDLAWAEYCIARYEAMVFVGDFFDPMFQPLWVDAFDVVVMNPPFEDEGHLRFVLRALEIAPVVVGVFPTSFEYGGSRDRLLWARKGVVRRRARLPSRVDYGGDQSPSFDSVVLTIERRQKPRQDGELANVVEEVWVS
jgi:predicted RNA methylase